MGKYYIDYGTGVDNEWFEGSLQEAKNRASEAATYTGCGIIIEDENGNTVAERAFISAPFDYDYSQYEAGENADIVDFGDYGYLDAWSDEFIY